MVMATKNISLPSELQDFVDEKVASGEYAHASEVVREGLRLLVQRDLDRMEWLRSEIAKGIAAAESGDVLASDEAWREIRARGKAMLAQRRRKA